MRINIDKSEYLEPDKEPSEKFIEGLKDLIFETVGEFTDTATIHINLKGTVRVSASYVKDCFKQALWDDWKYHKQDTEYQEIGLYL